MGRKVKETHYLRTLFDRNARSYDRVNPLLSLGQVYLWRRRLLELVAPLPGERILDAFCGPGSLGRAALPLISPGGAVVFADLSPRMLEQAERKAAGGPWKRRAAREAGRAGRETAQPESRFVLTDLLDRGPQPEDLQSPFDAVLWGFGLRYTEDPGAALRRLGEYLVPGGRLGLLEFTAPGPARTPLDQLSRLYFRELLPGFAHLLTGERELYEYLRDSSSEGESVPGLVHQVLESGLELRRLEMRLGGLVTLALARRPDQSDYSAEAVAAGSSSLWAGGTNTW